MTSEPLVTEPPISVREAAERLGISSVRVRHYLRVGRLAGFRDNRGHWRIATPLTSVDELRAGPTIDISAADAADLLVDEIIELKDLLAERDGQLARIGALVERQHVALDDAARIAGRERNERLAAEARIAQLSEGLARALAISDEALAKASRAEENNARLKSELAEKARDLSAVTARLAETEAQNKRLGATLDRALKLLDDSTARLALVRESRARVDEFLVEANREIATLSDEKAVAADLLARREAALDRALKLLERMVEAEQRAKELRNSGQTLLTWVWRRLESS